MRLVGHHSSLQQLWDMENKLVTDKGLQAQCSVKAHQSWSSAGAVAWQCPSQTGMWAVAPCRPPACMGSRPHIVAPCMHLGDLMHMQVAVGPSA